MNIDSILFGTEPPTVRALDIVFAISEAVRAAGDDGVPAGQLYAVSCGGVTLTDFEAAVAMLGRSGLVKRSNDLLTWTGPKLTEAR